MPRTITLAQVTVDSWAVDVENRRVLAEYSLRDAGGKVYERGQAVFWAQFPPQANGDDGQPLPRPANWYLLPAAYRQTLVDLTRDLRQALAGLIE